MPTIAVVGAGPGLGLSIAKAFGSKGFTVALIARNEAQLEDLVVVLTASGITAAGLPADVTDRPALSAALKQVRERFGHIDVLEYSPDGGGPMLVSPEELTVDSLAAQIDLHLYGAVAATNAVLPAMLEAGAGTLLYTVGSGAITPWPFLATVNAAQAALRNWVINLSSVLGDKGIHVAYVSINVLIAATAPENVPHRGPDDIAAEYWQLYTDRGRAEVLISTDGALRPGESFS